MTDRLDPYVELLGGPFDGRLYKMGSFRPPAFPAVTDEYHLLAGEMPQWYEATTEFRNGRQVYRHKPLPELDDLCDEEGYLK